MVGGILCDIMELFTQGISLIMSRKDSRMVCICCAIIFFCSILFVQNIDAAMSIASFNTWLGLTTLFDFSIFSRNTLIISILGSLIGAINISLAYTYIRLRGKVILSSGLYSGIGLLSALIGIGCAACGTAFTSVIVSFFGIASMFQALPYKGEEVGYIGIIILSLATYSLSRKVSSPLVC